MQEEFNRYVISLYQDIPTEVYEGLVSVFCLGAVAFFVFWGFRKGFRYSARLLLIEYEFLLFSSTVIYRMGSETRKYDWHPFWSYRAIEEGRGALIPENIMNVVVFVPIGLLLGIGFSKWSWWKAIGTGCLLSVSIEAMQLMFKRGFCEVDDVIHNTLGCIIGYILVKGSLCMVKGLTKK